MSTKKEDFLQESLKLIHEKGFKATTMRDIAEQMNFDVSNSYNFIKSKQDILENFLFDMSNEFHQAFDNILDSSYSHDEKLKQIISAHIKIASTKPFEVALMVNEWRNLKEPRYSEYVLLRDSYEQKIAAFLQDGIKKKVFKDFDVDIAKNLIMASLRWFYDSYTTDKTKINPIELERQIIAFLFTGFVQ